MTPQAAIDDAAARLTATTHPPLLAFLKAEMEAWAARTFPTSDASQPGADATEWLLRCTTQNQGRFSATVEAFPWPWNGLRFRVDWNGGLPEVKTNFFDWQQGEAFPPSAGFDVEVSQSYVKKKTTAPTP